MQFFALALLIVALAIAILYCLRVDGRLPAYDKLLAQRLLVECDETAFLAVANKRSLN